MSVVAASVTAVDLAAGFAAGLGAAGLGAAAAAAAAAAMGMVSSQAMQRAVRVQGAVLSSRPGVKHHSEFEILVLNISLCMGLNKRSSDTLFSEGVTNCVGE